MPVDASIFNNIHSYQDYNMANQDFLARQKAAQLDAATKANVLKAQVVGAGAGSGDQSTYTKAVQSLQQMGIDTSDVPPDINGGVGYANAAINAQKPYALGNAQIKAIGANAAGIAALGSQSDAAAAGLSIPIPAGAITPAQARTLPPSAFTGMNSMLPALIQQESGGNPNAVSPAGAQGIAQIMPATATDPGYGVQPLQGMQNGNPATAPVAEQLRFSNDYLNAMQAKNGGNPQLAAASYNAGPGRVEAALAQLPKETQNYVANVAPPQPVKAANESPANFNARLSAWEKRIPVVQANAKASAMGKDQAEAEKSAIGAAANYDQVVQTINGIKDLNDSPVGLPQDRGFMSAKTKAYLAQNIGDTAIGDALGVPSQAVADNSNKFTKLNEAQTIGAIKELASTGQIRMTRTLENILNRGYLIEPGASPKSKDEQAQTILAELNNSKIAAQNVNTGLNGGNSAPMQPIPASGQPQMSLQEKSESIFNAKAKVAKHPESAPVVRQRLIDAGIDPSEAGL